MHTMIILLQFNIYDPQIIAALLIHMPVDYTFSAFTYKFDLGNQFKFIMFAPIFSLYQFRNDGIFCKQYYTILICQRLKNKMISCLIVV